MIASTVLETGLIEDVERLVGREWEQLSADRLWNAKLAKQNDIVEAHKAADAVEQAKTVRVRRLCYIAGFVVPRVWEGHLCQFLASCC